MVVVVVIVAMEKVVNRSSSRVGTHHGERR